MSHEVSGAYGARAEQYHELLGTAEEASPREVELITRWAQTLDGPVIDAGAGSGRWTNYLNQMGLEVMGMDITPELVAIGRHQYPGVALNLGPMDSLLASDGYLAGILAWYSIIHTPPEDLPAILTEFNRALSPGGSVLLSYFDGPLGAGIVRITDLGPLCREGRATLDGLLLLTSKHQIHQFRIIALKCGGRGGHGHSRGFSLRQQWPESFDERHGSEIIDLQ